MKSQRHIDPVRVPDARQRRPLVLPRAGEITSQLAPRVSLDEALQRRRIARIVEVDPKTVARLVDFLQPGHRGLVEGRNASHLRQGLEPGRNGQSQQPRQRWCVVVNVDLDLVVGGQRHWTTRAR